MAWAQSLLRELRSHPTSHAAQLTKVEIKQNSLEAKVQDWITSLVYFTKNIRKNLYLFLSNYCKRLKTFKKMSSTRPRHLKKENYSPISLIDKDGMETHSSILAWRTLWTEKPGGLQSMGSQRVRHNWATEHAFTHTRIFDGCKCKNPQQNISKPNPTIHKMDHKPHYDQVDFISGLQG